MIGNLNKEYLMKKIIILLVLTLIVLGIDVCFLFLDVVRKANTAGMVLVIGLPIGFIFLGVLLMFYLVIKNINKLKYNKKENLIINKDNIIYDSYYLKKVKIIKEDIEKIYFINHFDDLFFKEKYLAIVTKTPIKEIERIKDEYIPLMELASLSNCLYINLSQLDINNNTLAEQIQTILKK